MRFKRIEGITGAQAIAQTPDGWLWFGGPGGLVRFDGRTLTNVQGPWGAEPVRELHATPDGFVWVVTGRATIDSESLPARVVWSSRDNALYRGQLRSEGTATWERVADLGEVWTAAATMGGGAAVATKEGLFQLSADLRKSPLSLPSSDVALALAYESSDVLVAGGTFGVKRYRLAASASENVFDKPITSLSVSAGRLVVAGPEGVKVLDDHESVLYAGPHISLLGAEGKAVYTTTGWGLLRLTEGQMQPVAPFVGKVVRTLFRDREDTLWVGTWGTGVFHSEPAFVTVPKLGNTPSVAAFSVLSGRDGTLWVTSTAGLNGLSPDGRQKHISLEALDAWSPRGLAELALPTPQGSLLVAAEGFGVLLGDGFRFTRFRPSLQGQPAAVTLVFALPDGGAAIGLEGGIVRLLTPEQLLRPRPFDPGRDLDKTAGLCGGNATAAALANDGTLWLAHPKSGLSRWDGTHAVCLRTGLPGTEPASLLPDPEGGVWVGFADPVGLAHVEGQHVSHIDPGSGIARVFGMATDDGGRMWLTSDLGVAVARLSDLRRALRDPASRVPTLRVGFADGLPSEDCVAHFSPSIVRMQDGRMAVPTLSGLAIMDPALPHRRHDLTTVIESVSVRGHPRPVTGTLRVGVDDAPVDLSFTAPTSIRPETLRFEYSEGDKPTWTLMNTGRTLHLAALEPGSHVWKVRAVDEIGSPLGSSATVTLFVSPPWWRHPLTLAAVALLLFGLGMGVLQIR
ncbi:MAG: hypothetical protein SF187_26720, partial [Deltaproteobacteria bacterium]|nr:hypothetical protein [Deltaproteobacteria bacterium]